MVEIRTGDLVLRPIELEDAARFAYLCNDIDVARNTSRIAHPYSRADADAFVAKRGAGMFGDDNEYVFAVCRENEIVACAGAHGTGDTVYEIGYWVGADYRRQGIATRTARAVTQFAFLELGATVATAGFFADNPTSGRVLDRAGFKATGETIAMHSLGRGESVDTARLTLARADFEVSPAIVITAADA